MLECMRKTQVRSHGPMEQQFDMIDVRLGFVELSNIDCKLPKWNRTLL